MLSSRLVGESRPFDHLELPGARPETDPHDTEKAYDKIYAPFSPIDLARAGRRLLLFSLFPRFRFVGKIQALLESPRSSSGEIIPIVVIPARKSHLFYLHPPNLTGDGLSHAKFLSHDPQFVRRREAFLFNRELGPQRFPFPGVVLRDIYEVGKIRSFDARPYKN